MATVGIDLGGTKIFGVRAELDGAEPVAAEQVKHPTPDGDPAEVVAAITAVVEELGGADRVGVGAPGPVHEGVVLSAPNLTRWTEPVPLAALLADALDGTRVRVSNDVNVADLGEHRAGAGRGTADLLAAWVGTGVGGGLVLGGEVREGRHGLAGGLGHAVVHPGGRRCGCGGSGHLEAYAGRAAMELVARERHAHGQPTALVDLAGDGRMKSGTFAKALAAGDEVATELLDDAVAALGIALASVATVVDLEGVALGGGVADKLGAGFVGRAEQAVRFRLFGPSPLRVVPAQLGDAAGALGAALLAAD